MRGRLQLKPGQSAKCIEALKALHGPALSRAELAEKESAIAKVRAEDERKRRGEQQDLLA